MPRRAPDIPLVKTTLHLPEDVLLEAKRAAPRQRVSFSKWVTNAMRQKLVDDGFNSR
jgi:hypothetical protein